MLYREIIAVCSQFHTKHINILCGQNIALLIVKLAVHIVTNGLKLSPHQCHADRILIRPSPMLKNTVRATSLKTAMPRVVPSDSMYCEYKRTVRLIKYYCVQHQSDSNQHDRFMH